MGAKSKANPQIDQVKNHHINKRCRVLAIETSCDDTSVAIVTADGFVEMCLSANQDLVHRPYGGVVPEIASRNHTLQILPLIEELFAKSKMKWSDVDGIAVTSRPGLIGSLLVGVVTAKTLALVQDLPLIGVNHLEAHLLAPFLYDAEMKKTNLHNLGYPYLALAISGGHTQLYLVHDFGKYEVIGRTMDDAAGEAFDKFAKHLGLGFPGGALVDKAAKNGNERAFALPRTMIKDDSYDFSFSGLKSAAIRLIDSLSPADRQVRVADLCASFQAAIVESLLHKLDKAAQNFDMNTIVLTGGVSANSRLRSAAQDWADARGSQLFIPPLRYCTDNAAMVGYVGALRIQRGEMSGQNLAPKAASEPGDFL